MFFDNLRINLSPVAKQDQANDTQSKFINNYRALSTPNQEKTINFDFIKDAMDERSAGNDESENPIMSMDIEIPDTPTVRKIRSGEFKISNDINKTAIGNDNALYIVGNTYQRNNDGTYYGMGWDGRPYSYTIKNKIVSDFAPLGIDEQKKAINRISDGKITIHETITNPGTLAEIYRSIKRMNENGNGKLIPDNVVIGDSYPGTLVVSGLQGVARKSDGTKEKPDHIDLLGADFPDFKTYMSDKDKQSGWSSAGGGDAVPQHELAHTAEFALLDSPYRYYEKISKDAEKYDNKYSANELWRDAVSKIKYAIPVLMDSVFGTHIVPSKEEVEEMRNSDDESKNKTAEFWDNYYTSPADKYRTVGDKMRADAYYNKVREWERKYDDSYSGVQSSLFKKAAKNTGFDSVEEAMASISKYAASNESEAFAEAYTDVLLNRDKAKPFSKELIRLYTEAADDAAKTFGKNKPTQLKMLDQLFNILPDDFPTQSTGNTFYQNYQQLAIPSQK